MNQYSYDTPEKIEDRARQKVEQYAPAFEYAGNYGGSEGYIDIRCKVCGTVQTKAMITLRQRHTRCDACYRAEIEQGRAERAFVKREAKEKEKAEKAKVREAKWFARFEASIKQGAFAVCCECGSLFVKPFDGAVCCSPECTKRHGNNHKDRRLKGVKQDRGISLRKVYEKDKGICYLCGQPCDWQDYETRDGTVICGNNYPSIDHIVPLAKGGTHTWDNVRLAHRWCNTVKSDIPL